MERTNQTASGYTYNGQNFTNETRTDSQGQKYTVAIPTAISASNLTTPQATLLVTQPQYNTATQQAQTAQMAAYPVNASQTADQNLAMQVQAEKDALQASQSDYSKLLTESGGRGADLATQYNQKDATGQSVNTLAAKLRQLSAQSQALGLDTLAKQEGEINKATGQNITQAAVQRNTADATRENLINTARIAMESAIVNADYQTAKSYADQMVDAEYDQLEANRKAALFNLENMKEKLTASEKKVAEATTARLKKEEKADEEKKANEKTMNELVMNASAQGAPQDIRDRAMKAKTPMEAANILGVYAGDYMKMQTYKSQLETDKAQRANIYSQIAERNAEAIKKQQLANFQAPPIVNATTGQVDPKSAIASIIKSTGGKLKGGQAALDVLSSVQALANRNAKGTFEGIGFGSGVVPERFKSQNEISNRQDIEAIGLKVQQWASGASLTEQQTEMVNKFTPQLGDSDNAVKKKINGLVNFMMGQVSSDLVGQGINYSPETIDMFSGLQSVDNQTLLSSIPSSSSMQSKVDNKTFFTR